MLAPAAMSRRTLRSASAKTSAAVAPMPVTIQETPALIQPVKFLPGTQCPSHHSICDIRNPGSGASLLGLSASSVSLLRRKQRKLRLEASSTLASLPGPPSSSASDIQHEQRSLASTLIFAQETAGTAICISASGLVLTCAHCIAEDEDEYARFETSWLLFYTGHAVQVKCLGWDPIRDLALLQIVSVEAEAEAERSNPAVTVFSCVPLARSKSLCKNAAIYCIGQPGRDDLESAVARKTAYNLIEVSWGKYRGILAGANVQDNSAIGALKHDAWTYWGHSGAPLLSAEKGELSGLHSSWHDGTGMRHGVHGDAIREFLAAVGDAREEGDGVREELDAILTASSGAG